MILPVTCQVASITHSCPLDQKLGALTKRLASWLLFWVSSWFSTRLTFVFRVTFSLSLPLRLLLSKPYQKVTPPSFPYPSNVLERDAYTSDLDGKTLGSRNPSMGYWSVRYQSSTIEKRGWARGPRTRGISSSRYIWALVPRVETNNVLFRKSFYLKRRCHEIFCLRLFSWIIFPQAPDNNIRVSSNFFENLWRYSQVRVHHRYQLHCRQICHRWQIIGTISEGLHLKNASTVYVNSTVQLPKVVQTKYLELFWLKIFSIFHRCQRHQLFTLNCEYLHEFSKKFKTALMEY